MFKGLSVITLSGLPPSVSLAFSEICASAARTSFVLGASFELGFASLAFCAPFCFFSYKRIAHHCQDISSWWSKFRTSLHYTKRARGRRSRDLLNPLFSLAVLTPLQADKQLLCTSSVQ